MTSPANRWCLDVQAEWPEFDLPSRQIMHMAQRDRAHGVTREMARAQRRLTGGSVGGRKTRRPAALTRRAAGRPSMIDLGGPIYMRGGAA